jgi:hypothetical protein
MAARRLQNDEDHDVVRQHDRDPIAGPDAKRDQDVCEPLHVLDGLNFRCHTPCQIGVVGAEPLDVLLPRTARFIGASLAGSTSESRRAGTHPATRFVC